MAGLRAGFLTSYNSLTDKHLVGYFNKARIRQHLQRSGLISRSGRIIPEKEYQLNAVRKENERYIQECLAEAVFHKLLDTEQHHQLDIKRKPENSEKKKRAQKIKVKQFRRLVEDASLMHSPHPPSGPRNHQRLHPLVSGEPPGCSQLRPPGPAVDRNGGRPSRPHQSKQPAFSTMTSLRPNTTPGNTQHPLRLQPLSSSAAEESVPKTWSSKQKCRALERDEQIASGEASSELRRSNSVGHATGTSPCQLPVLNNAMIPVPPPPREKEKSGNTTRNGMPSWRRFRPATASNDVNQLSTKNSGGFPKSPLRSNAIITMVFLGNSMRLHHSDADCRHEIKVYQQHCGGENLCVYRGELSEGETFQFISKRHRGFPFSLTLFLNGMQVDRLSCCCEYRHQKCSRLGGRHGTFGFLNVEGASPCYRCLFAMGPEGKPSLPTRKMEDHVGFWRDGVCSEPSKSRVVQKPRKDSALVTLPGHEARVKTIEDKMETEQEYRKAERKNLSDCENEDGQEEIGKNVGVQGVVHPRLPLHHAAPGAAYLTPAQTSSFLTSPGRAPAGAFLAEGTGTLDVQKTAEQVVEEGQMAGERQALEKEDVVAEGGDARTKEAGEMAQAADLLPKEDAVAVVQAEDQLAVEESAPEESALAEEDAEGKETGEEREAGSEVAPGEREGPMEGRESKAAVGEAPAGAAPVREADGVACEGEEEVAGEVSEGEEAVEEAPEAEEAVGVIGALLKEEVGEVVPEAEEATEEGGFAGKGLVVGAVPEEKPGALLETLGGVNLCRGEAMPGEEGFVKPDELCQLKAAEEEQLEMGPAATGAATSVTGKVSEAEGSSLLRAEDAGEASAEPGKGPVLQVAPELEVGAGGDPIKEGSSCLEKTTTAEEEEGSAEALLSGNPSLGSKDETESTMEETPDGWLMGVYAEEAGAESGGGGPVARGLQEGTERAGVKDEGEQPGLLEDTREGEVAGVPESERSAAWAREQGKDSPVGGSPDALGAADTGEKSCGPGEASPAWDGCCSLRPVDCPDWSLPEAEDAPPEKEDVVAEGGDARTKEAGEMAQAADLLPKEDAVAVVQAEDQLAVEESAPEESALAEEDAEGKETGEEREAGSEVAPGEREGPMEGRESKAAVGEAPAGAAPVREADGVACEGEEEVAGEVSEGEEAVQEAPEAEEAVGVIGALLKEEVGEVVPEAEEATEEGGFAGKGLVVGAVPEEKPGALLETLGGVNLCRGEAMPGEEGFVKPDELCQLKAAEEEQLEMGPAATGAATSVTGKVSEAEGSSLLRAEDAGEASAEPGKGPVLQVAPELEVGAGGDPIKEGSSCLEKTTTAEEEEGSAEALLSGNPSLGSKDETESTMEETPDGWLMGVYAEEAGAESGGGGPVARGLQEGTERAGVKDEGEQPGLLEDTREGEVAGVPESERSAAWAREQGKDSPVGGSPDALGAADTGEKSCGPGEASPAWDGCCSLRPVDCPDWSLPEAEDAPPEKEDVVAERGDARTKEAGEMAQAADLLPKEDAVAVVQAEDQLAVEESAPEESALAEEDAEGKETGEEREAGSEVAPGEREGPMEGRESKAAVGEAPAGAAPVREADGVACEGEEEVAGEVSEGEEAVQEAPEAEEAVGVIGALLKEEVGEVVPEAEEATEEGGFAGKGLVVGAVPEEKPGALLETLGGVNLCRGEAMPGEEGFVKPDELCQLKAAEEEQLEMGPAATGAATSATGKVSEAEGSSLLRAEDAGEASAEPGKGPVLQVAPELEVGAGGDPIKEGSSCLEKTTTAEEEEGSAEALLSGNPSLGSKDETESTMEETPDGWLMGVYAEEAGAESGGGGPVARGLQEGTERAGVKDEGEQPGLLEDTREGEVAGVPESERSAAWAREQGKDSPVGGSPDALGAADTGEKSCGPGEASPAWDGCCSLRPVDCPDWSLPEAEDAPPEKEDVVAEGGDARTKEAGEMAQAADLLPKEDAVAVVQAEDQLAVEESAPEESALAEEDAEGKETGEEREAGSEVAPGEREGLEKEETSSTQQSLALLGDSGSLLATPGGISGTFDCC